MAKIGKNVIENLTTAMYEDLRIIYREYIQNSADSIDKAIKQGILTSGEARIEIEIDPKKKLITIEDNGIGIKSNAFKRIMGSIADSTKDRAQDKGFRGIGRLGGISSCNQLKFSCSAPGESVISVCIWDAKKVRDILIDRSQNPSAAELVDDVTSYYTEPCSDELHFFKVELVEVQDSSSELLDIKGVKEYLSTVAPIPYSTGFVFKYKIAEFTRNNGFIIDEYNVFVDGERLYKPYKTKLYDPPNAAGKSNDYDQLVDVAFEIFRDNKGKILAWMWFGICKFEKQIPSINTMRGIRLRKSNIQIGNETTFLSHGFYKEPREGLYFVGEVFAISPDLIPNARRDYFNLNDTCREFEEKLRPLFYDKFYSIYHKASEYKKALQKQQEFQSSQNDYIKKLNEGGFVNAEDKADLEKKVQAQKEAAEKAARKIEVREQKEQGDEFFQRIYEALRKDYQPEQPTEVISPTEEEEEKPNKKNNKYMSQGLSKYNKKEQKLIGKIYTIIKSILPPDTATMVINKIQEELSK